jgi:hypothetical protein
VKLPITLTTALLIVVLLGLSFHLYSFLTFDCAGNKYALFYLLPYLGLTGLLESIALCFN